MLVRDAKASKGEKRTKASTSQTAPRKKADTQPSPLKRGKGASKAKEQEEEVIEIIDADDDEVVEPVKAVKAAKAAPKVTTKGKGRVHNLDGKADENSMAADKEDVPNYNFQADERVPRGPFRLSSPQRAYELRTRSAVKGPFSLS